MFHGKSLKEIREDRKISQQKLASLIGRSPKTIYRWEVGTRTPSLSEIHILAKIFNVDIKVFTDSSGIDFTSINESLIEKAQDSYSFIDNIESSLSIQDRIFLTGVNAELQNLRDKVSKLELKTSTETIADEINSFIYKKDLGSRKTRPCAESHTGAGILSNTIYVTLRRYQPLYCRGFGRGSISFKARSISSCGSS